VNVDKFLELLRESVLVQATLAVCCTGVICYLAIVGGEIPEVLVNSVMLILGFYFGAKAGYINGVRYGGKER